MMTLKMGLESGARDWLSWTGIDGSSVLLAEVFFITESNDNVMVIQNKFILSLSR